MKKAGWTHAPQPGDLVRVVAGGAMCWDVLDVARTQDVRVRGGTPGLVLDSSVYVCSGITADCARVLVTDSGLRWIRLGNLRSTT